VGASRGKTDSGLGAREGSTLRLFRGDRPECSARNRLTPAASGDGPEEEPSGQKGRPPHWIGQPVRDQSRHTAQREHRKRSPGHYAQDPAWDRLSPALNRGKGHDEGRSAQSDDQKIEVVAPGAHHQRVIRPAAGKSRRYAKCPPQVRRCEQHCPCARSIVKQRESLRLCFFHPTRATRHKQLLLPAHSPGGRTLRTRARFPGV